MENRKKLILVTENQVKEYINSKNGVDKTSDEKNESEMKLRAGANGEIFEAEEETEDNEITEVKGETEEEITEEVDGISDELNEAIKRFKKIMNY
jgi:predicted transcriptional regulator